MILTYLSWASYLSLFRLKIPFFTVYNLNKPKGSDVYALCFNAVYLCRFQFSLIYHFFTLLQIDKYKTTSFYVFIGQMETVPFLGKSFSFWLPIICVLTFVINASNVILKLLEYIGFDPWSSPQEGNPDHNLKIREGKTFIREYRHYHNRKSEYSDEYSRRRASSLLI